MRRWEQGQSSGKQRTRAQPSEWEFLARQQPGGGPSHGAGCGPCSPPGSALMGGHRWGETGGTEGHGHGGGPWAEPHKAGGDVPAVRTEAEIHRGGKRGNTKGVTAPYCPVHPPDTVLQHCSQPGHCLRAALTISGGTGGPSCPPHPPPATQRGLSRAPRSPGGCWCPRGPRHFWSASASLREEGRGRGRGSGPLWEPGGRRQPREWPLEPRAAPATSSTPRAGLCSPSLAPPMRAGQPAARGAGGTVPRQDRVHEGGPDPLPLTLVLQGLEPLASLVVQLLQVRGPRAGEEDVVGAFLARLVLHAQPLVVLSLGRACKGRERAQRTNPCRTAAPRPTARQDAAPEPPP